MKLSRSIPAAAAFATLSLLVTTPVAAQGLLAAVKLNRATVDASIPPEPGVVDSTRTRGGLVLGYQLENGVEFAMEHWSGSTGTAACRSATNPCPAVAIPTEGRFTSATVGYEFGGQQPGGIAFGVRGGVEFGRLRFGNVDTLSEVSALAGATVRYRFDDRWSVGLDVSASTFETRTIGLELRTKF